jgi:hypothetical protein
MQYNAKNQKDNKCDPYIFQVYRTRKLVLEVFRESGNPCLCGV